MALRIIPRAEWGARYPDGDGTSTLPASYVYLHHSATVAPDLQPPFTDDDAAVRQLEAIGQQRFGAGISYTFAVTPTGRVYEGHSVERQGTHTAKLNDAARAIVLVGNYDRARVTAAQIESVAQLLVDGWRAGWWLHPKLTGGHRDSPYASTECPGDYAEAAIPTINQRAAQLAAHDQEDDDVPTIDRETIAAIAAETADAVWLRHMGTSTGGGVTIPDLTAGDRLDALHRLAVLGKKRNGEIAAAVASLDPGEVAELVPVEIAAEVIAQLGRRLYEAAPPPAAAPPAPRTLSDVAVHQLVHDPDSDGPPLAAADVDEDAPQPADDYAPQHAVRWGA